MFTEDTFSVLFSAENKSLITTDNDETFSGCHCSDPLSITVSLHFVNVSQMEEDVTCGLRRSVLACFNPLTYFLKVLLLPKVTSEVNLEVKGDVCPPDGRTGDTKTTSPTSYVCEDVCAIWGSC